MLGEIGAGRWFRVLAVAMLVGLWGVGASYGQEQGGQDAAPDVTWQEGPGKGELGSEAQIKIPSGYRFTGAEGTRALMEFMGNPTSGREMGLMAPTEDKHHWFVVFEFEAIGYVKDEEKDKLKPDEILKSIREGTEAANEQRKQKGHAPLEILGWDKQPTYNDETHNLEWSIRGRSEGKGVINYNVRVLGRNGVMSVELVGSPEAVAAAMPKFRTLLAGFTYTSGNKYAEFKPGDKIAKYGLTALITGGSAALLLKAGILQRFWKLIVIGVAAIAAAVVKAFKKIFGRKADA